MEKYSTIIVAVLSLLGTLIGSFASGSKTKAIIEMRISALEKKVDKHNQVIDRTYELEKCKAVIEERLQNIEEDIDLIKSK